MHLLPRRVSSAARARHTQQNCTRLWPWCPGLDCRHQRDVPGLHYITYMCDVCVALECRCRTEGLMAGLGWRGGGDTGITPSGGRVQRRVHVHSGGLGSKQKASAGRRAPARLQEQQGVGRYTRPAVTRAPGLAGRWGTRAPGLPPAPGSARGGASPPAWPPAGAAPPAAAAATGGMEQGRRRCRRVLACGAAGGRAAWPKLPSRAHKPGAAPQYI